MSANAELQNLLRKIPSVQKFLVSSSGKRLCEQFGEGAVKYGYVTVADSLRARIRSNGKVAKHAPADASGDELAQQVSVLLHRIFDPESRRAINATGIFLHTALGRAPLSKRAHDAVEASTGYCIVQVDPETNARSRRDDKIEALLQSLTDCEAATVITNNAAATFLLLHVMAKGKEVIISRGQLVEIGGEFRMPDVMEQSGAILREVGATNRTHLKDYERAIGPNTAAILYVHPSNYHIEGFASVPDLEELGALSKRTGIPLIADLGSGALVPLADYGVKDSITISQALAAGATVTCSSGDKLICGPQAGIICGDKAVVEKVRKSPFARMFRTDKLALAALEATLLDFATSDIAETIPLYQMLATPLQELERRASLLAGALAKIPAASVSLHSDIAYAGGGSLPAEAIPSRTVRFRFTRATGSTVPGTPAAPTTRHTGSEEIARELRLHTPPVFCRIQDDHLVFDTRTLLTGDIERLISAVTDVCNR